MAGQVSTPFDLSQAVVGLHRDGKTSLIPNTPGPPARIDGFTVGAPMMARPAPHGGEMHPDGDELLFLISGHASVVLEEQGGADAAELATLAGHGLPPESWAMLSLKVGFALDE